jgi:hypothetical protein
MGRLDAAGSLDRREDLTVEEQTMELMHGVTRRCLPASTCWARAPAPTGEGVEQASRTGGTAMAAVAHDDTRRPDV